ncbi:MAG TPA: hypothetical protein VM370_08560 [Candidatus Thermoplasmatota archaeon]|nr:hypothetical protein [Candidatus Thermoplasmatota archaeon]
MTVPRDRLLTNAGGLLIAAGALAAFAGAAYGLAAQRPGIILSAVVLLMGYGVVGYLLMNHGARYFQAALPATAVLVLGTLLLFQSRVTTFMEEGFSNYVLLPALTLLLVFAGGALLTHVGETMTSPVKWPPRGAKSVNALLHVAAYAPVWCAFTLLDILGNRAGPMLSLSILTGSVAASIACVVGAHAATRGNHPAFTVLGAAAGFVACAGYLFQFMLGRGGFDGLYFGQLHALVGLVLSGLPLAIGAVAWIQISHGVAGAVADEPLDAAR